MHRESPSPYNSLGICDLHTENLTKKNISGLWAEIFQKLSCKPGI